MSNDKLSTILKLIAPETVEVELVPLATIEKAEFLYFWVSIFLSVWSALFGTWISLVITNHQNHQVVTVIGSFLIFLTLVVIAFGWLAFRTRSKARKNIRNELSSPKDEVHSKIERIKRVFLHVALTLPEKFEKSEFYDAIRKFDDEKDGDDTFIEHIFTYAQNNLLDTIHEGQKVYYKLK
jgi:cbb3-type cytochrome oxidase subunit 3